METKVISLLYCCYLCESGPFSTAQILRLHLLKHHEIALPSLDPGSRHKNTSSAVFIKLKKNDNEKSSSILNQFACPSCLDYFNDKKAFEQHVVEKHLSLSKRKSTTEGEVTGNTEGNRRQKVQLPTKKAIYYFSPAQGSILEPNLPKLSVYTINKLTMITIITNYNNQMTQEMKAVYTQQLEDQTCLKSLTTYFPIVYKFVLDALKFESYQELPKHIWSYQHSPIQEELEQLKLI